MRQFIDLLIHIQVQCHIFFFSVDIILTRFKSCATTKYLPEGPYQKANNSLGVESFVMSWQRASSGLTWGQGGVPLVGNSHILSPLGEPLEKFRVYLGFCLLPPPLAERWDTKNQKKVMFIFCISGYSMHIIFP